MDTTQGPKIENRPLLVQGIDTKTGTMPGKQGKKTARPESMDEDLTLKQSLFVRYYTDINSPTYGNQTRSWIRAYGNQSYMGAAANATRALKTAKTANWIDVILRQHNVGTEARVARLSLIAAGQIEPRKIRRQVLDKQGNKRVLVDRYDASHGEQLKAIDQLNKLSGDYAKAQASVDIASDDLKQLLSNTFTQDKARTVKSDAYKDDIEQDDGQTMTGEGD